VADHHPTEPERLAVLARHSLALIGANGR
jgi:hypothetical protein